MEGNPDVIFAVDRDEVAHCVPGAFLKVIDLLRQRPQHLHEVLHHLSLSLPLGYRRLRFIQFCLCCIEF